MTTVSNAGSSNIIQSYMDKQKEAAAASSNKTTTTSSSKTPSKPVLSADLNTFLNILTTQLKYQDPTQATNTDAFTQELVQFAQVEQSIQTNEKMDKLIEIGSPNGITPLLGYVGKTVEAETGGAIAVQNGKANFTYTLDRLAKSATITITDSTGKTVSTVQGNTAKGEHKLSWDAKDAAGKVLPDGKYKVTIAAKDINGATVDATNINLVGIVTGLETETDGTATLSVGGVSFKASKISSVYSAVATAA